MPSIDAIGQEILYDAYQILTHCWRPRPFEGFIQSMPLLTTLARSYCRKASNLMPGFSTNPAIRVQNEKPHCLDRLTGAKARVFDPAELLYRDQSQAI